MQNRADRSKFNVLRLWYDIDRSSYSPCFLNEEILEGKMLELGLPFSSTY